MRKTLLAISTLIAFGSPVLHAATRTITCHQMVGGQPSSTETTYTLRGNDLVYRDMDGKNHVISRPGLFYLSTTKDRGRYVKSWASHKVSPGGSSLVRSLYWSDARGRPKLVAQDRYDFAKQKVVDLKTGEDSCYHDAS